MLTELAMMVRRTLSSGRQLETGGYIFVREAVTLMERIRVDGICVYRTGEVDPIIEIGSIDGNGDIARTADGLALQEQEAIIHAFIEYEHDLAQHGA